MAAASIWPRPSALPRSSIITSPESVGCIWRKAVSGRWASGVLSTVEICQSASRISKSASVRGSAASRLSCASSHRSGARGNGTYASDSTSISCSLGGFRSARCDRTIRFGGGAGASGESGGRMRYVRPALTRRILPALSRYANRFATRRPSSSPISSLTSVCRQLGRAATSCMMDSSNRRSPWCRSTVSAHGSSSGIDATISCIRAKPSPSPTTPSIVPPCCRAGIERMSKDP